MLNGTEVTERAITRPTYVFGSFELDREDVDRDEQHRGRDQLRREERRQPEAAARELVAAERVGRGRRDDQADDRGPDRHDEAVEEPQRQVGVGEHVLEGLEGRPLGDQREGRVQQLVAGSDGDAEHAQDREEGDERGQDQHEVDHEPLQRAILACCSRRWPSRPPRPWRSEWTGRRTSRSFVGPLQAAGATDVEDGEDQQDQEDHEGERGGITVAVVLEGLRGTGPSPGCRWSPARSG